MVIKKLKFFIVLILFSSFFLFSASAFAQPVDYDIIGSGEGGLLNDFTVSSGFDTGNDDGKQLGQTVAIVIKAFLSLLGIIFIILMLIAGYNWMSAGGDEQKVTKAKDTIMKAIIGLVIIVAAYSITYFVFRFMPFGGGAGGNARPLTPDQ